MSAVNINKKIFTNNELQKLFKQIHPATLFLCFDLKTRADNNLKINQIENLGVTEGLDDICPFCLNKLGYGFEVGIDYCKYSCGHYIHAQCFDIFYNNKGMTTKICLFCGHIWNYPYIKIINMYE